MKTLYDFPKEIIIKMLIDVNNVKNLSDEQLLEKINVLSEEKERRENEKRLDKLKEILLEMYDFKDAYGITLQNYKKLVSDISKLDNHILKIGERVFALNYEFDPNFQNFYYVLTSPSDIGDLDLKSFQKFLNDRVPTLADFNRLTYILKRKIPTFIF